MVRPVSPGRPDYTASVPTEVLLYLLLPFSFEELLPVLAVNRRWRAVAIDSEPYWSFVRLDSLTAGAANLFVTRIARTKERLFAISVNLRLEDQDSPALQALQSTVLSTLREHLHNIHWLLVYLGCSDAPALWHALGVSAPDLRYISLRCELLPAGTNRPVVSADLFAGVAPLLRSVTLVDVDLPQEPLSAFSKVTKFDMLFGSIRVAPDLFHHFPALERVCFPNDASFQHPSFHTASSYGKIKDCLWRSGRGMNDFRLPLPPTRNVQSVTVYNPRTDDIRGLIDHLRPPLWFKYLPGLEYPEDEFELVFSELDGAGNRRRMIIDETSFWEREADSDLRRALTAALAGKLQMLNVDAAHWGGLARCMPEFPGLQHLRIYIESEGDVAALPRVGFPSSDFRTFELVAPRCMWVPERDVIDFAVACFDSTALRETILQVINIHLRGSPRRFSDVFQRTKTAHDRPCLVPPRRPAAQS